VASSTATRIPRSPTSSRARTFADPHHSWDLFEIAACATGTLRAEAARLDAEQSVRGIDALDELALHAVIRAGIAGLCPVLAEQRYPEARGRARRTEGPRCDIIVLPRGGAPHLIDPLEAGTLFGEAGVEPCEALWLEVKGVWHHAIIDGIARPDPAYSAQITRHIVADARKLAAASGLAWAAVLVAAFHAERAIADHDLARGLMRIASLGLGAGSPILDRFAITDRIGNGVCTVALIPVRDRPPLG
jgi:hypothetical protein